MRNDKPALIIQNREKTDKAYICLYKDNKPEYLKAENFQEKSKNNKVEKIVAFSWYQEVSTFISQLKEKEAQKNISIANSDKTKEKENHKLIKERLSDNDFISEKEIEIYREALFGKREKEAYLAQSSLPDIQKLNRDLSSKWPEYIESFVKKDKQTIYVSNRETLKEENGKSTQKIFLANTKNNKVVFYCCDTFDINKKTNFAEKIKEEIWRGEVAKICLKRYIKETELKEEVKKDLRTVAIKLQKEWPDYIDIEIGQDGRLCISIIGEDKELILCGYETEKGDIVFYKSTGLIGREIEMDMKSWLFEVKDFIEKEEEHKINSEVKITKETLFQEANAILPKRRNTDISNGR